MPSRASKRSYHELWKEYLRGGYPGLTANPKRDIRLWHASYIQTYLERDVRTLRQVNNMGKFFNADPLVANKGSKTKVDL